MRPHSVRAPVPDAGTRERPKSRGRSLAARRNDRRERLRRTVEEALRGQSPRLQMLAILVPTGAVGFLVSWALLHLGLTTLWLRYPVAVAAGYGAFLLLLRVWLAYQRRRRRGRWDELDDVPDLSVLDLGSAAGRGARAAKEIVGGGGRFGGAGASGSYDGPVAVPMAQAVPAEAPSLGAGGHGSGGGSHGLGGLFDLGGADEGTIPLVVIAALVATTLSLALAAVYLVWTAPALLAEVLVDSVVLAALSHRLRRIDSPLWIGTVLRRTWLPAAGVALALALTGFVLQRWHPAIDSIGDVARLLVR